MTQEIKKWTALDVANRFEESVYTLKRLPGYKIKGYYNTWPDVVRSAAEILQAEPDPLRLGPPSAAAISRMEETLQWIFWLDSRDERRLIWLKAEKIRLKFICARLGYGRTKIWQMWVVALLKISTRLNARQEAK